MEEDISKINMQRMQRLSFISNPADHAKAIPRKQFSIEAKDQEVGRTLLSLAAGTPVAMRLT